MAVNQTARNPSKCWDFIPGRRSSLLAKRPEIKPSVLSAQRCKTAAEFLDFLTVWGTQEHSRRCRRYSEPLCPTTLCLSASRDGLQSRKLR